MELHIIRWDEKVGWYIVNPQGDPAFEAFSDAEALWAVLRDRKVVPVFEDDPDPVPVEVIQLRKELVNVLGASYGVYVGSRGNGSSNPSFAQPSDVTPELMSRLEPVELDRDALKAAIDLVNPAASTPTERGHGPGWRQAEFVYADSQGFYPDNAFTEIVWYYVDE